MSREDFSPRFASDDPEAAMSQLLQERHAKHGAESYMAFLIDRYARRPIYHALGGISVMIEPIDRTLGRDEELPAAKSFLRGSLLGLRAVQFMSGTQVISAMEGARTGVRPDNLTEDDIDDRPHMSFKVADTIMRSAQEGLRPWPEFEGPIEDLAAEIIPGDFTQQSRVKRGFGFSLYLLGETREIEYVTKLEEDLRQMNDFVTGGAHDFDWDQAFFPNQD